MERRLVRSLKIMRNGCVRNVKKNCNCEGCKLERGETDTEVGRVQILKIIARCKQPGPNSDWEYLVRLKGRTLSKDFWIKAKDMIGEDLHSKYQNTLKIEIDRSTEKEKERELEREKEKERKKRERKKERKIKSPRTGTASGSNWRTSSYGRPLRSRDYDISRVIFNDGPHKIVIPAHKNVVTPHWRIIPDFELDDAKMVIDSNISRDVNSTTKSISDGTSINKINGIEGDEISKNDGVITEGMESENENTSDETYTKRHSKYEHKWPPLSSSDRSRQKKKRKSG